MKSEIHQDFPAFQGHQKTIDQKKRAVVTRPFGREPILYRKKSRSASGTPLSNRYCSPAKPRCGVSLGRSGHQHAGVAVLRCVQKLLHRAVFDDFAVLHHHHLVRHGADHIHIMGDQQIAQTALTLQLL